MTDQSPTITGDRAYQHEVFGKPDQSAEGRLDQMEAVSDGLPDEVRLALYEGVLVLIDMHYDRDTDTLRSDDMRLALDALVAHLAAKHPDVEFVSINNARSAAYAVLRRHGVLTLIEMVESNDPQNRTGKRASLNKVHPFELTLALQDARPYQSGKPSAPARRAAVAAREAHKAIKAELAARDKATQPRTVQPRTVGMVSTPVDAPAGPVRLDPTVAAGITLHTLNDDDMALF